MRKSALVLILTVVAACSPVAQPTTTTSSGSSSTSTSTTAGTTSTSSDTTSTTVTSIGRPFTYTGQIKSLSGPAGALGSGCAPGGDLTDGVWFGWALGWTEDAIDFDLACWFSGEQAEEIGRQRGEEVNNDYLIVNDNPMVRQVPVRDDTVAWRITDTVELERVELADFLDAPGAFGPCPGEFCGVWLFVNDGEVTEVVRQYQP